MKKILIYSLLLFTIVSCTKQSEIIKAKKMLKNKQYVESINILEKIDHKDAQTYFLLANAYAGIRKFSIADSFYSIVLNKKPEMKNEVIKQYSSIALTDFMKGYTYSAINYWKKILDINPSYDINIGFYYLGEYEYNQKNYLLSKELLLNALNISLPSSQKILTYKMIIDIYKNEGILDTALTYAYAANNEFNNPSNQDVDFTVDIGELIYRIAYKKYQLNEIDNALNLANQFLTIKKPLSLLDDVYLLIGDIYFDLQNYKDAIIAYKKVIELNDIKLYGSRDTYKKANEKLKIIVKRSMK